MSLTQLLAQRPRQERRLFELVLAPEVREQIAALLLRPQPLLLAVPVAVDDGRCRIENRLRRPIVLFEAHRRDFREVVFEVEDVAQVCAAPLVDGLVGIANDGDVVVRFDEALDQQVLRTIRILILVDHHEAELALILGAHDVVIEQLDGPQQEVVEVEGVGILQGIEVALVDLRDLLVAHIPAAPDGVRALHPVLRVRNARQHRARLHGLVIDVQRSEHLLDG